MEAAAQLSGVVETVVPSGREGSPLRKRLLGELLVKEGLISEFELETALRFQRDRGGDAFLGQILVDQKAITQKELNAVLDRYHKRYRLGDILVENGALTESQLEIGLDHHRKTGLRLGDALLQLNFVSEQEMKHALCIQLGVTFVDLDKLIIDRSLALLISKEYAQRHRVIPIAKSEQSVTVAVADPADAALAEELEGMIGGRVNVVTSTDSSFQRAFTRAYGESPEAGLSRQHTELGQAYQALTREHEASLSAFTALRSAQTALLQEREASTRLLAEQRTRNEWNTHVLTDLQVAHETVRGEHDRALAALSELRTEHGATCAALTALQAEHATARAALADLQAAHAALRERAADVGEVTVQRARNDANERTLAELRGTHEALRREAEEAAGALRGLRERYAEATRTLADLEAAHQTLLGQHEASTRALRERESVLSRQAEATADLEAVLRRLRG